MNRQTPSKIVRVPASTTNLGAGFDALGLALGLYLKVEIQDAESSAPLVVLGGEGVDELPADANNLIYRVMRHVFSEEGLDSHRVSLRAWNEIPVTRGLGSSAAAIVAGIGCFEALTNIELSPEAFFRYAFAFEVHPDNLAAARYGGFTISCVDEHGGVTFFKSTIASGVKILLVVPEIQLQTEKARAVIPRTFSQADSVFNLQRSSLTVAALLQGQFHLLRESLRDRLHQPFRASLIPGFSEILELQNARIPGLLGLCLSGAGPSILAFADSNFAEVTRCIADIFDRHRIASRFFELEVDNQGRRISDTPL
ncbi:MAG TPA: homoserine kinase [Terriglobia bacterium]|nr:homoserine kinase [Terriglobia bacterium]